MDLNIQDLFFNITRQTVTLSKTCVSRYGIIRFKQYSVQTVLLMLRMLQQLIVYVDRTDSSSDSACPEFYNWYIILRGCGSRQSHRIQPFLWIWCVCLCVCCFKLHIAVKKVKSILKSVILRSTCFDMVYFWHSFLCCVNLIWANKLAYTWGSWLKLSASFHRSYLCTF